MNLEQTYNYLVGVFKDANYIAIKDKDKLNRAANIYAVKVTATYWRASRNA